MKKSISLSAFTLMAALATVGTGMVPAAAAFHKTSHTAAAPKLALAGHHTFWECTGKTTEILIVVNKLTLHPGDTLSMTFIVRNGATAPCNYVAPYAGAAPGPTSTALQIGPCGSMGFEIQGSHHSNVWPGSKPFNCPALGFAQLQPNATVQGAGSWAQTRPSGSGRVAAGNYTLVVDGHFSFPLHIAAH
jgi:hypothetical protein